MNKECLFILSYATPGCVSFQFPKNCAFYPNLPPVLFIFVQSFVGLCVLTFILGMCYEAWYAIIWVIIYDLFPISTAPDASAILSFIWGVATLVVPIFQTLILGATSNDNDDIQLLYANETYNSLLNSTSLTSTNNASMLSSEFMTTSQPTDSLNVSDTFTPFHNNESRSYGNQLVMTLMCVFLTLAILTQFVMYFAVIKRRGKKDVKNSQEMVVASYSNPAFE